ncbi:hypothetical protein SAMN05216382_1190 [Sphingomonas palmae]|uniref:Uncharacterized protein n=1 Tax=Sphingomonas palmae TaxID=1855283 RepID=A0A1H7LBP7_9SPHN|nr:hypothetical protein [Sphingomonas palmae]SEK95757.1 hypothetical protein SAMN05216382_1190 [Sphingomonas palmae]
MASTFPLERVRHYVLPAVAALIGLGVAIGIATVPSDVLNAAVDRAGFNSVLPAAASPIGTTGRTILALLAGALIAACGFAPQGKAWLLDRPDAFARRARVRTGQGGDEEEDVPVIRRADAHPDAPPRRPIRAASDLGDPLPIFGEEDQRSAPLPPPAEQPLPADLDRPLADFDPAAVPLRPMAPPEPLPPLSRRVEQVKGQDAPAPRFAWLAPEEETAEWVEHVDQSVAAAAVPMPESSERAEWIDEPTEQPHRLDAESIDVAGAYESHVEWPPAAAPQPAEFASPQVFDDAEEHAPIAASPAPTPREPVAPRLVVAEQAHAAVTPPHDSEDESIAGLLARLERGAAQRRIVATPVAAPAPAPTPAPPPAAAPASLDDTLQRLRRLAAS